MCFVFFTSEISWWKYSDRKDADMIKSPIYKLSYFIQTPCL